MTAADLQLLLDYHYWARDRLLAAVESLDRAQLTRDLGSSFPSIHDTLVHTYAAEWAWHSRWHGLSPTSLLPSDRFPDLPALVQAWSELEGNVRRFVADLGEDGIDRRFTYTLLSGQQATSSFWEMLQHVVNHATYHRGQVTTMLRQIGAPPPRSMDLITFHRERVQPAPQPRSPAALSPEP